MKIKSFTELRKNKFATRVEFARAFGISEVMAYNYENGIGKPRIREIPRLAELLGCSIEEIVLGFIEEEIHHKKGD